MQLFYCVLRGRSLLTDLVSAGGFLSCSKLCLVSCGPCKFLFATVLIVAFFLALFEWSVPCFPLSPCACLFWTLHPFCQWVCVVVPKGRRTISSSSGGFYLIPWLSLNEHKLWKKSSIHFVTTLVSLLLISRATLKSRPYFQYEIQFYSNISEGPLL